MNLIFPELGVFIYELQSCFTTIRPKSNNHHITSRLFIGIKAYGKDFYFSSAGIWLDPFILDIP